MWGRVPPQVTLDQLILSDDREGDLVAIGLAHSCRSAYHQCQHLSKRALTRWGTRILSARA